MAFFISAYSNAFLCDFYWAQIETKKGHFVTDAYFIERDTFYFKPTRTH